jgi:glycosyltransferase involved in cell wall biosynthesis
MSVDSFQTRQHNEFVPIIALVDRISWFGRHTGYELLETFLSGNVCLVRPRKGLFFRIIGKVYSFFRKWPARNQSATFSELELLWRWKQNNEGVAHILYGEEHIRFFTRWSHAPKNWIVTIHQPPFQWNEDQLSLLRYVNSAIILYKKDIPFFEEFIGRGRIKFIHHGVDTEFFRPGHKPREKRILYAGVHLRNIRMLYRLVSVIYHKRPDLKFDFLVPEHRRIEAGLKELKDHPAVTWHSGLDDNALRDLYQKSYLLLLPMEDSGANTAVVESLACGLPILTTDVGGIRDYGGGEVFPLAANNDDSAMLELIEAYLDNPEMHSRCAQEARRFAERTLAWPLVASKHMQAYAELSE